MSDAPTSHRTLGLFGATNIGVGAIVGGGILALAGAAFQATGPGAMLAFGLNGLIAIVTALSFAELSSAYPQSGGTYLFAKRVLAVGAAFYVGWVVWFASILAAALYAIGFATFLLDAVAAVWTGAPGWFRGQLVVSLAAIVTVALCVRRLAKSAGAGGNWINIVKVAVFAALIAGGVWAWGRDAPPAAARLEPLLPMGLGGLAAAMGYTFIALQGFDLVAAVAGEVKQPRRVLPAAMLLSLAIALLVYLPMLLLVAVAGVPAGVELDAFVATNPNTIVARAAEVFLGPVGFWLVMVAGVLSMLSALVANLFAASRIAQVMARDRTLPAWVDRSAGADGDPTKALWLTGGIAAVAVAAMGDVGNAGAASSLIFLVSFALVHGICILARQRRSDHDGFRVPLWPWLPALGGLACSGLAAFQGAAVPAAGGVAAAWLIAGFFAWILFFEGRARIVDAASELADPDLLALRGRSPLVLVPIANPSNASPMAFLGACIAPPGVGRVLLLHAVPLRDDPDHDDAAIAVATDVLGQAMRAAMRRGVRVEGLATLAVDPWLELERVARARDCASVLLGLKDLATPGVKERLQRLATRLPGDLCVLRAPPDWRARDVRRVLVPVGGRLVHNALRARLLGGLLHRLDHPLEVTYLFVLPEHAPDADVGRAERQWRALARDETSANTRVEVVRGDDVVGAITGRAADCDLLLLGLGRSRDGRHVFGAVVEQVVAEVDGAILLMGQSPGARFSEATARIAHATPGGAPWRVV